MSDAISRLNAALEGRYEIEREIGQGGMATVYLAHDVKHERKVAVKVLKPELAAVVGAERFLRDIKPANILLSQGQPLVADFGIALAVGAAGGGRLTETGMSLGTPYYMSPEQATGDQAVGAASDTFALACVLYEMLIGEPPYPGNTAQAVLGKIIQGLPVSATAIRASVPANVDAAIRKALEKLPADRFTSAHDLAKALADPAFRHGEAPTEVGQGSGWKRVALASMAASVVFGAMAVLASVSGGDALPVTRYAISLPDGHDPSRAYGANLVISPDGSTIVYVGPSPAVGVTQQLWMRRRDQLEPTSVNGTEGALNPVFSPDGSQIAFHTSAPNQIKVASLSGAPPVTVASEHVEIDGLSWSDDGFIYTGMPTTDGSAIGRLPATGGEIEPVTTTDSLTGESFHAWPQALPGGRKLLATIAYNPGSNTNGYRIAVFDIESGEGQVVAAGVLARYSPTGHLVYVTPDGQLLASTFDPDEAVLGPPAVLAEGVSVGQFGSADLAIGNDGALVYMVGSLTSALGRAVWVDRAGTVTPVDPEWEFDPGMPEAALVLSPDGTRLAAKINTDSGEDIWVKELPDGPLSRLTFDDGIDRRPRWSADGSRIFYNSDRSGNAGSHYDLWSQPSDGTGSPEKVLDLEASILEARLTPDESMFVLRLGGLSGAVGVRDLVGLRVGDTETFPVAAEPYDEKGLALSPSGRWVAYESTETGRDKVYVRPFPDAQGGKWQVSTSGGINPQWSHSENELFFVDGNGNLVAAQVETVPSFRVGQRQTLFSMTDRFLDGAPNYASWDVAPDDQRFMMLQIGGGDEGAGREPDCGSELLR